MSEQNEKQAEAVAVLKNTLALHQADPDAVNVAIDLGRLRLIAAALGEETEVEAESEIPTGPASTQTPAGSEGS